jgi:RNA polymerase sigma-70 factor (ECF subfamily)
LNSPYTDLNDAELIEAARCEAGAFDALYRRYVQRVYRYCSARVGKGQDAEDLTAQIFLAVLESLDGYEERSCFAAWLFGIARNICASYHRHHYAHPELTVSREREDFLFGLGDDASEADTSESPERAALRNERLRSVKAAIEMLSDDRREAIYLRFFWGLSSREMAEVMGKKVGAVKMLIWRGLNDLRRRCTDEA